MQEPGRQCQHPDCKVLVVWRGSGRVPRYCHEHQGGAAAKARQRLKDKEPQAPKSQCCEMAGRVGGRITCPQHKSRLGVIPEFNHFEEYAGAKPRRIHKPERRDLPSSGYRYTSSLGMLTGQWMTERYSHNGQFIRVIGQTDLDVNWRPIPGKAGPEGLIRRGPDWPWAEESSPCAGCALFEYVKGQR